MGEWKLGTASWEKGFIKRESKGEGRSTQREMDKGVVTWYEGHAHYEVPVLWTDTLTNESTAAEKHIIKP